MNKILTIVSLLVMAGCMPPADKTRALSEIKVPVYAWMGGPGRSTDKEIKKMVEEIEKRMDSKKR